MTGRYRTDGAELEEGENNQGSSEETTGKAKDQPATFITKDGFKICRGISNECEYPKLRSSFVGIVRRSIVISLVGILIEMFLNKDLRVRRRPTKETVRDFFFVRFRERC